MIVEHDGAICIMPAATCATNATQGMSIETAGYGEAVLDVIVGTHATNGAAIGTLKLSESDTVTSPSSMTDIVALTGGTATSTSVGFVIPGAASLGPGGAIEFQVDLRKRKRYLGLTITPGSTTMNIAAIARLVRGSESDDTATQKSAVTNNVLGTSATQVGLIVRA